MERFAGKKWKDIEESDKKELLDQVELTDFTVLQYIDKQQELTQKEVAQIMGISQSYISRLEKRIMLRLRKELVRQTNYV